MLTSFFSVSIDFYPFLPELVGGVDEVRKGWWTPLPIAILRNIELHIEYI